MITTSGLVPVQYSAEKVFAESLRSEHIPRRVGVLSLAPQDKILDIESIIDAQVGVGPFRFHLVAAVYELHKNELLQLRGQSRDAEFGLRFDFDGKSPNFTEVSYDFELDLKSSIARKAELLHGRSRTDAVVGGFILGIINNVQTGLAATYGPAEQLSA